MIGRTLSHYRVLSEISRGGMGIVYRALDVKLNREVALKVLPPELVTDLERKRRPPGGPGRGRHQTPEHRRHLRDR